MVSFLYKCPISGIHVQGWLADEVGEPPSGDEYVGLNCLFCTRTHLINLKTGHVLGESKPDPKSS